MIIQRYIAKTIIITTLLVLAIVMALAFFIGLLGELRDIGNGDYGIAEAFIFSLLRMPFYLYQFFPMLMLLGGVVGLSFLVSTQEMMIMQASGVSIKKVMLSVFLGSLVLILVASLFGELLSPYTTFMANKRKESAQNGGQAVATASGVWIHEKNNFIHIDRVTGKNHLEGVTRYQFDAQHHLLASYYAESLDYKKHQWIVNRLVKTLFLPNEVHSSQLQIARWEMQLNPSLINVGLIQPEEMSLKNLYIYSKHLQDNGLQSHDFQFSFWKRLLQPAATILMLMLAIPFVFSVPRSLMMGWRIFGGILVGFAFYMLNAFLGQLSIVLQFSPLIAALLPIVIFAMGGWLLAKLIY